MSDRRPGPYEIDLAALHLRLEGLEGPAWWRSVEELASSPAFRAALAREFPAGGEAELDPLGRRRFLRLMGASLALAGLGACTRQPRETILPYVDAPEGRVPGRPLVFATAMTHEGFARGLLVSSHEGRPTKVEGNPRHPASLGATDAFAQASVLGLYDPDRSQVVSERGRIRTFEAFLAALAPEVEALCLRRGQGLRLLTGRVTSPTLAGQIRELLGEMPEARWHAWEAVPRDSWVQGALLAFGEPVETRYRLDRARVVVSLDADPVGRGPDALRHAREIADARQLPGGGVRLYAVETTPTLFGALADHRLPLAPSAIEGLARALARALGVAVDVDTGRESGHEGFIAAVARGLLAERGASAVIAGDEQPAAVHALAHAMNHALGNVGSTVIHTEPVVASPPLEVDSLRELAAALEAGAVDLLLVLGANPVYDAPADLDFARAFARARTRVHLGQHVDETAEASDWHVPEAHFLEAWSDARALDGTVSIVQPLIAPLYDGLSVHELLAALLGRPRSGHDLVRERFRVGAPAADLERTFRLALSEGVIEGSEAREKAVAARAPLALPPAPRPGRGAGDPLEVVFRPDPTVWDGRFAGNAWLQELPKPLTTLTWDNAALLSPRDAERLALRSGDLVELHHAARMVRGPVLVLPGHAPGAVTLALGHGRRKAGKVGTRVGFDAGALRLTPSPGFAAGLELRRTGLRHRLALTQAHHAMEGRDLVRVTTRAHLAGEGRGGGNEEAHGRTQGEARASLYPPVPPGEHAWAMAIDLDRCIGCNACVAACQAENNIPVVGKAEVLRGREMHWLRVDRYFEGGLDRPRIVHQPVPCMHCENAPCEPVCPVEATVHSADGLNQMVYNRCVGTRYCSNNCPYKVRRFNFFAYSDLDTESLKLGRNPDVTVRTRGVMEKCTYCVQRINRARIRAEVEDRELVDGEIATACEAACPTRAIVFGDLQDPASRVAQLRADPRSYALLGFLNTRPRTTYLARVRDPDPELEGEGGG